MTDRTLGSPQLQARIAGLLYLIVIATGVFAEFFVRSGLIVRGDAAATATNILKAELLFRLGLAADLVCDACYIGVTALLYLLLKPVSRNMSVLAAFFSLVGCAVMAANMVNYVAPLLLLKGAPYLDVFNPGQLQALALTSLRLQAYGYNISLVFFGWYCILLGYLIIRSTFIPRTIGVLMAIAGLSGLVGCFATFLSFSLPDFGILSLIGEGSLALWLFAMGVNKAKWSAHNGQYSRS